MKSVQLRYERECVKGASYSLILFLVGCGTLPYGPPVQENRKTVEYCDVYPGGHRYCHKLPEEQIQEKIDRVLF